MTDKYHEIHIIVRHAGPRIEELKALCSENASWVSQLSLDESKEEKAGDLIVTTRTRGVQDAFDFIRKFVPKLRDLQFMVTRSKIESIIHDERYND